MRSCIYYCLYVLIAISLATVSIVSEAKEARIYSTEGYCILAFEQVDDEYLKTYEERLGFRPKNKLCSRVNRLVSEFQPVNWNYQFGQPYPGSSIYLNPEQVDYIHKAQENKRHALR